MNDKAEDGQAGAGMVSPKVKEFTELWAGFKN